MIKHNSLMLSYYNANTDIRQYNLKNSKVGMLHEHIMVRLRYISLVKWGDDSYNGSCKKVLNCLVLKRIRILALWARL